MRKAVRASESMSFILDKETGLPDRMGKLPRYDKYGEKVTNPFTYCALQALAALIWEISDWPMTAETEWKGRIWIEFENLNFRAMAEIIEENKGAEK